MKKINSCLIGSLLFVLNSNALERQEVIKLETLRGISQCLHGRASDLAAQVPLSFHESGTYLFRNHGEVISKVGCFSAAVLSGIALRNQVPSDPLAVAAVGTAAIIGFMPGYIGWRYFEKNPILAEEIKVYEEMLVKHQEKIIMFDQFELERHSQHENGFPSSILEDLEWEVVPVLDSLRHNLSDLYHRIDSDSNNENIYLLPSRDENEETLASQIESLINSLDRDINHIKDFKENEKLCNVELENDVFRD